MLDSSLLTSVARFSSFAKNVSSIQKAFFSLVGAQR